MDEAATYRILTIEDDPAVAAGYEAAVEAL